MKILFVPIPGIGHVFPMVPLAWALRAAGHDVAFLAGFDGVEARNAGLTVIDVLPGLRMEDDFAEVQGDAPDIFESMAHLTIEQILDLKPMVLRPWDRYTDRYVEAAKRHQPDLIVYDPVFSAGLIAAAALDVPAIGHGYMLLNFTPEMVREVCAEAFERHQVGLPKKIATVEIGPPSLMEADIATWQMRYVPYGGGGVLPSWLSEPPQQPRVAVTLGSSLPHRKGTERYQRIIDAVRDIDAEFALTVNEAKAAELQPLPDNVRATGWVPLQELLRTCTAAIHHGGSGTMFTACISGLPQLIIPEGADNDYNARILRAQGTALHLGPTQVDTDAIVTLLRDASMRSAAARLRQEIEEMPTPADVVDQVISFARA